MLEKYFVKPTRIRQLRRGPLGPYLDDFAAELHRQGFALSTGQHHLSLSAKFSTFARSEGVIDVVAVDDVLASKFLHDLAAEGRFPEADCALRLLLAFLRTKGVISSTPAQLPSRDPSLDVYDAYLREVKGLQPSTREGYVRGATRFLRWAESEGTRPRQV